MTPPRMLENGHMALKVCKHGPMLYNVNDTFIGRSLDLYGEWGEEELELLGGLLRPGQVVVDVGANIGTHTVFFAQAVGPEGLVVALEPQRLAFHNLCANVALNALTNVACLQRGAAEEPGVMQVPARDPRQPANFGATSLGRAATGEPVDVVRIDDLGLPGCDLIKVDVEGMERDVLAGARSTIAERQPVLFVENNTVEGSPAILGCVDALGYRAYWHLASYYHGDNFFQNPENVFTRYRPEINLLCLPAGAPAMQLPAVEGLDDDWQKVLRRL